MDHWQLMWRDESSSIYLHLFDSRAKAVGFIEAYLAGQLDPNAPDHDSTSHMAKRKKVAHKLIHPDPGDLVLPEGASDVLSPDEVISLQARHLLNMLNATPLVSSARAAPSGMYT